MWGGGGLLFVFFLVFFFVFFVVVSFLFLFFCLFVDVFFFFFAMNYINYARWLPVHRRYMKSLPILSPSIEAKFGGPFVVHMTRNKFSGLALVQVHE